MPSARVKVSEAAVGASLPIVDMEKSCRELQCVSQFDQISHTKSERRGEIGEFDKPRGLFPLWGQPQVQPILPVAHSICLWLFLFFSFLFASENKQAC